MIGSRRFTITGSVLAIIVCILAFFMPFVRADVNDFSVRSFTAHYYLERNEVQTATLRVQEIIKPVFPDFNQNHGILRAIPKTYQGRTVSLEIDSVTNANGQPWEYTTYTENDNLVLKIGDADKYVQGEQTYEINYRMKNVILFLDDHDEFYWDINGDQWLQPFDEVTARIHVPQDLAARLQDDFVCFAGSYGFNEVDCVINRQVSDDGATITASAKNLGPRQTLTTVMGFEKNTFTLGPEIAAHERLKQLIIVGIAASVLLPPLFTALWSYGRWRKYGRDPSGRGVIIPEYLPPKGLNPIRSNAVLSEKVESKGVTALIVELAIKKYLHIYEIPKKGLLGKTDYELEVIGDVSKLEDNERQALEMFFSGNLAKGNKVKLSALKNKLYDKIPKLSKDTDHELHLEGYFQTNPGQTRKQYVKKGVVVLIAGAIIAVFGITIPLGIGVGLSGLVILLVSNAMPARSQKGVAARDYLLGLRDYMKLAEAERLKVLQSPKGAEKLPKDVNPEDPRSQVKLFEKLLPYAMLFGIEKDWAKQFEHLYTQPPDWYSGNWSTFNSVRLASSLGGFSAASNTSFSSPSSSGSSGFSGGSSGGGGGGGGGGGW